MAQTDEIVDPQLGKIQPPKTPKRKDAERLIAEQARAFAKQRLWKEGSVAKCPSCGRDSFVGRSDLSHEIGRPGGVVVFRRLKGAKCANCQAQSLEPSEQIQIEREAGIGQVADYEAKVSNIGSGTVGTYWPKDVVRVMDLGPDTKAFIQILDRDTALIKFTKGRHVRRTTGVTGARKHSGKAGRAPRKPGA